MKRKRLHLHILCLAVLCLLPAIVWAAAPAVPTSSAVYLDGQAMDFEAYNIGGNNYFKLRDLAQALSGTEKQFEVSWDTENQTIMLISGQSYTPAGGEMASSQNSQTQTAVPTVSPLYVNGTLAGFTAYNIAGNNYFKLRDVGELMNFSVEWDGASNAVLISSSAPYQEQAATVPEPAVPEPNVSAEPMTASSSGVTGGVLADAYGMRGSQQADGVPTRSLPLSIQNAPSAAVSFAVIMLDPDSVPLCGYEWVHWLAADFTAAELAENASVDQAAGMVQGVNDFGTLGYGGPTPPDKPHTYKITVYALDQKLGLNSGFDKDTLLNAMQGHILEQVTIEAQYSN